MNLNRQPLVALPASALPPPAEGGRGGSPHPRPVSRERRKQIACFFTPNMSFAMHMLSRRQSQSLQALMAEAFNDVLSNYGGSPIRE